MVVILYRVAAVANVRLSSQLLFYSMDIIILLYISIPLKMLHNLGVKKDMHLFSFQSIIASTMCVYNERMICG